MSQSPRDLASLLRSRVQVSTSGRVRELAVQTDGKSVSLHGSARCFHVKQLALNAVRLLMPDVVVHNRIQVEVAVAT